MITTEKSAVKDALAAARIDGTDLFQPQVFFDELLGKGFYHVSKTKIKKLTNKAKQTLAKAIAASNQNQFVYDEVLQAGNHTLLTALFVRAGSASGFRPKLKREKGWQHSDLCKELHKHYAKCNNGEQSFIYLLKNGFTDSTRSRQAKTPQVTEVKQVVEPTPVQEDNEYSDFFSKEEYIQKFESCTEEFKEQLHGWVDSVVTASRVDGTWLKDKDYVVFSVCDYDIVFMHKNVESQLTSSILHSLRNSKTKNSFYKEFAFAAGRKK
jgi:hypothetical protein